MFQNGKPVSDFILHAWYVGRIFCGYLILRFFPNRKNSQNIVPANNSNNKVSAGALNSDFKVSLIFPFPWSPHFANKGLKAGNSSSEKKIWLNNLNPYYAAGCTKCADFVGIRSAMETLLQAPWPGKAAQSFYGQSECSTLVGTCLTIFQVLLFNIFWRMQIRWSHVEPQNVGQIVCVRTDATHGDRWWPITRPRLEPWPAREGSLMDNQAAVLHDAVPIDEQRAMISSTEAKNSFFFFFFFSIPQTTKVKPRGARNRETFLVRGKLKRTWIRMRRRNLLAEVGTQREAIAHRAKSGSLSNRGCQNWAIGRQLLSQSIVVLKNKISKF